MTFPQLLKEQGIIPGIKVGGVEWSLCWLLFIQPVTVILAGLFSNRLVFDWLVDFLIDSLFVCCSILPYCLCPPKVDMGVVNLAGSLDEVTTQG